MVESRTGGNTGKTEGEGREEVDVVDDGSNAFQAISILGLARIAPSSTQLVG